MKKCSSKVEIIIHIGDGKCGTTSIQNSLTASKSILADKHRILYHPVGYNHFGYVSLLNVETRGDSSREAVRSKNNIQEISKKLKEESYKYVLFSAESFISHDPYDILNIIKLINADEYRIHVVAYVRDPIGYYLSVMQQKVKGSGKIIPSDKYFRNFLFFLDRWSGCDRVDSFTLRPFERNQFVGGSVVNDFASLLSDITEEEIKLPDMDSNVSVSAEQLVALQDFRRDFLASHDGKMRIESNVLLRFFEKLSLQRSFPNTKPQLCSKAAVDVAKNHKAMLLSLKERYSGIDFIAGRKLNPYFFSKYSHGEYKEDVRSIIVGFDQNVVDFLKSVNPFYTDIITSSWLDDSKKALARKGVEKSFLDVYERFVTEMSALKISGGVNE